jgi:hypothetical protein
MFPISEDHGGVLYLLKCCYYPGAIDMPEFFRVLLESLDIYLGMPAKSAPKFSHLREWQ